MMAGGLSNYLSEVLVLAGVPASKYGEWLVNKNLLENRLANAGVNVQKVWDFFDKSCTYIYDPYGQTSMGSANSGDIPGADLLGEINESFWKDTDNALQAWAMTDIALSGQNQAPATSRDTMLSSNVLLPSWRRHTAHGPLPEDTQSRRAKSGANAVAHAIPHMETQFASTAWDPLYIYEVVDKNPGDGKKPWFAKSDLPNSPSRQIVIPSSLEETVKFHLRHRFTAYGLPIPKGLKN
jgi:hypothetical protein